MRSEKHQAVAIYETKGLAQPLLLQRALTWKKKKKKRMLKSEEKNTFPPGVSSAKPHYGLFQMLLKHIVMLSHMDIWPSVGGVPRRSCTFFFFFFCDIRRCWRTKITLDQHYESNAVFIHSVVKEQNLKYHLAKNNRQLKYAESMILCVVSKCSQEALLWRNNYTGTASLSPSLILPTELFILLHLNRSEGFFIFFFGIYPD